MKVLLQPTKEPISVNLTIEVDHIEDVIEITPFKVTYEIHQRQAYLDLMIEAHVDVTLACAKTLKPVQHIMDLNSTIVFGEIDEADFEITKFIDLDQLVLGEIMAEKPVVVYHKDAENMRFEKEKNPSPFEALLKE